MQREMVDALKDVTHVINAFILARAAGPKSQDTIHNVMELKNLTRFFLHIRLVESISPELEI